MAEQSYKIKIDKLIKEMKDSKDAYHRKVAAEQLGELDIKDETVLNALRDVAKSDSNKYVRHVAMNSLEKLGGSVELPDEWLDENKQQNIKQEASVASVFKIIGWILGILLCLFEILRGIFPT